MNDKSKAAAIVSFAVVAIAAIVYLLTLTPTVPFWDSGEFIAVSKILGIPHPPGTPFIVLIGRLATLVPIASIAQRVNAVSALSSALAVLLTYLCILRMLRMTQGGERQPWHEWAAIAGAFTGAMMLAFSDNWWENSIEAEVYQMMSLFTIIIFWLGLKWWEAHEKKPTVAPLLAATYVMWVSIGLHPAVAPTALPLWILVLLVDWRVAMLFLMPFLAMMGVTTGLEHMAGIILVLGCVQAIYFAARGKLPGGMLLLNFAGTAVGVFYAISDKSFTAPTAIFAALGLIVPFAWMARSHREGRILLLVILLILVGYSTDLYLPLRAAQHPAINEGDPSSWARMRDLLERKQYGEMNMFVRRAPLAVQLNKEFWRYFSRQWPVFPHNETAWSSLLPLLLGLVGAGWQAIRNRKGFIYMFCLFGLNTAGLIVFLNFSDHEVRDRDYFFQTGYHVYAMWIGLGVAWLVGWIRESFSGERNRTLATVGSAGLLSLMPLLLVGNLWFAHDRSHNWVARDYAYDMLAPLKPNSFIFTNGDNDTFPLWYIQQAEGFRKDVRIVNLSLLNTDWYIRQLRDEDPKVPITLDDHTIDQLGAGAVQDASGRLIYTNEYMVHHIMEQSRNADGTWKRQPYFAVTVPEHYGYEPLFALQGLVYEVRKDSLSAGLDVEATRKALYQTFLYRGLFKADGSWDSTVYKDENAQTLSRNYAAAHLQLALYYRRAGKLADAIAEMERIQRMFPGFVEMQLPLGSFYLEHGDTARAMALFQSLARIAPDNAEVRYYNGASLGMRGNWEAAVREFEAAITLDPDYGQPYYSAYYLLRTIGQRERAVQYLARWVEGHPSDTQAAGLLQAERQQLGIRGTPVPPAMRPPAAMVPEARPMPVRALVTGAAGFIGSTLTERLLADGAQVTGVDCFTDYYDPALKRKNLATAGAHPAFHLLELDLGAADLAALPEVDVVFHQAAQAGVRASWGRDFASYVHHNVLATQRLLERYRDVKLQRFVYASSSSVYGDAERYPTDEALLPRPFSPYGVSKLAGEHLVLLYGRNFGLPVSALRYFTVYGPRQRPDMAFHKFCKALLRGEEIGVYGDGRQSRDFTYIDDAVEANVRAWQRSAPQGVYNVGGGSQVEVLEAIAILERALGVKARLRFETRPPGDPLRTRADASRLRVDLDYVTRVGIEDGLAAEAGWARGLYGAAS